MRCALLVISLCVLWLTSPCAAQQASKAITGYVRAGKEPISHVQVTSDAQASPTETDSNGFFRLELKPSITTGSLVWIHLQKDGYLSVDSQENYSSPAQKPCAMYMERITTLGNAPEVIINPFYDAQGRLYPGNEHVLKSNPLLTDKKVPVLQSGATLVTTLVRRGSGNIPVAVSKLQLRVSYRPDTIAKFQYDYGPSNLTGRAIVEALDYNVELDGPAVHVSRAPNNPSDPPIAVSSDNLLGETQVLSQGRDELPQTIKIHIGASENGLYEIELVAVWAAGGPNKESLSQKLLFYREE